MWGGINVGEGKRVLGDFPLGGEKEDVWHLWQSNRLW